LINSTSFVENTPFSSKNPSRSKSASWLDVSSSLNLQVLIKHVIIIG